jgi:hypothetical protein
MRPLSPDTFVEGGLAVLAYGVHDARQCANASQDGGSSAMSGIRPGDATVIVVEDNLQNFVLVERSLSYLDVESCERKESG